MQLSFFEEKNTRKQYLKNLGIITLFSLVVTVISAVAVLASS